MIEGTWVPITAELSGHALGEDRLVSMKLILAKQNYTMLVGKTSDQGTVILNTATHPMAMDIKGTEGPNKGRTIPAIYELAGDTLKVCYNLSGPERPTEFMTRPNTSLFLVTYKRQTI